jgi:hypothetical protein
MAVGRPRELGRASTIGFSSYSRLKAELINIMSELDPIVPSGAARGTERRGKGRREKLARLLFSGISLNT